jgi:acetyl-CoA/propionyl-CoA carboxylase biotin carboxyl carrier protein
MLAEAKKIGFPVMIKAVAGGGGRGMRLVADAAAFPDALRSARSEAQGAFGDPTVILERAIVDPRHIEIQVFGDRYGHAVHLGERDCSVQRRHQKLVEESPAALLSEKTRAAMGEAAVKVAKACGYVNAGTVEMLYQPVDGSDDGEFYFLEMNTRLQVEHCVTEMVTSLDLVAEQIRVANGEPLSFTQDSVEHHGHSIEVRVNAENAAKGFLPSPGTITKLRVPSGPGVRWDGGYEEGDTISQYYDNLLAKLVVWAPDRERARRRMLRALQELVVEGIHTTVPAHELVLEHPDFSAGHHSTNWLENEVDLSGLTSDAGTTTAVDTDGEALTERTVPVEVDGKRFDVKLWLPDTPVVSTAGAGGAKRAPKPNAAASSGSGGDGTVNAPMQGTIVKVLVNVGDAVEAGQGLLVLEAMKMENHIAAERSGTVSEIRVSAGETVGTGAVLVIIE